MKPFPFVKLELPSVEEIRHAEEIGHGVAAISLLNDDRRMFLKILCHDGKDTVVWLDAFMIDHLLRHFEMVLIGSQRNENPPVRTKFLKSIGTSLGTVPRD